MLEQVLQERLGFNQFRPGQKEIIEDVLAGENVFAMLPTGSGKTLCYLLSGWLLGGLTLIVSPLLSLMEDQVRQIKLQGEKRVAALNSFLSYQEKQRLLQNLSSLHFLFISPEMLQVEGVIGALKKSGVRLFVVDEAHCISQWGHDFRPDYLRLADIKASLQSPPCLALTATADKRVQQDIREQLDMTACKKHVYSIDRPNIAFKVEIASSNMEKFDRLEKLARELKGTGLVYFSSREKAELAAEFLRRKLGEEARVAYYHAGLSSEDRLFIQNQFLNDQLDLVCSTNAFGMGLNKSNIRYVIHFHYPQHLNAYLQEVGRAGRDGEPSVAITLMSLEDHQIPETMIEGTFPKEQLLDSIFSSALELGGTPAAFHKAAIEKGESETAARFLSEQVVQLDLGSIEKSKTLLVAEIKKRKHQKNLDLMAMRNWLAETGCRRDALLKNYDEVLKEKPVHCCDRCGLDLNTFSRTQAEEDHHEILPLVEDWEKRLSELLPFQANF